MLPILKNKWLATLFLVVAFTIDPSIQQDDGTDDSPDDGSDATDDSSGDDTDDECSLISGHSCNPNGICKYCAMCIQSSCILSKSSTPTASCNATQFGTPDVYDWYNYCLSSGNDSGGDYCATSLECYQYRKNSNSSVSHVWQNLTCDVSSCVLVTSSGQPAPAPGALPPDSSSSSSAGSGGHRHHNDGSEDRADHPHTTTIALTATCSFIFLVGIIWITRLWLQRARRGGFWGGFLPWSKKRRVPSSVASSETPSTAPPSFRSREMQQQQATNNVAVRAASSSVHSNSSRSTRSRIGEPLPSYFSPDPSPPKYEQAIVTQIRGLREHGILDDDSDHSSNGHNANNGSSSSQAGQGDVSADGHGALPPPLWLPVYFTPNHSAFSFGRLRRHPPNGASSVASSSHDSSPMWHHNNDWADPLRAFWYHHQQQIQQQQPHPQMQQVSSPPSSAQPQSQQQQQGEHQAPQPQPSNSSPPAVRRRRSADLAHILDRDAH